MPAVRRLLPPLLAAASLFAAACAGAFIPEVSPELVAAAGRQDGDPATLAQGRALYVRKCSGCHPLRAPARHTAAQWPRALDEMAVKANLTRGERALIENYLTAASAIPPAPR